VDSQHLGSNFKEPKILYHNNGNATFTDISAHAGPGIAAVSSARGLAVADLWNDGRMSAFISNMNAPPMLLVNDFAQTAIIGLRFTRLASRRRRSSWAEIQSRRHRGENHCESRARAHSSTKFAAAPATSPIATCASTSASAPLPRSMGFRSAGPAAWSNALKTCLSIPSIRSKKAPVPPSILRPPGLDLTPWRAQARAL